MPKVVQAGIALPLNYLGWVRLSTSYDAGILIPALPRPTYEVGSFPRHDLELNLGFIMKVLSQNTTGEIATFLPEMTFILQLYTEALQASHSKPPLRATLHLGPMSSTVCRGNDSLVHNCLQLPAGVSRTKLTGVPENRLCVEYLSKAFFSPLTSRACFHRNFCKTMNLALLAKPPFLGFPGLIPSHSDLCQRFIFA